MGKFTGLVFGKGGNLVKEMCRPRFRRHLHPVNDDDAEFP